jgi:hypothetical protein
MGRRFDHAVGPAHDQGGRLAENDRCPRSCLCGGLRPLGTNNQGTLPYTTCVMVSNHFSILGLERGHVFVMPIEFWGFMVGFIAALLVVQIFWGD